MKYVGRERKSKLKDTLEFLCESELECICQPAFFCRWVA